MDAGDSALVWASPGVSLVSKRVLASPVSGPLSVAAPQPSPESAGVGGAANGAGGAANGALSRTPEVQMAEPLAASPPWIGDEMRYRRIMTPPVCVEPERMVTPDVAQTYMHNENLDPRLVPNFEMDFDSLEHAYEFYRHYAELAGFNIKRNRKRDKKESEGQEFCCSGEGKHKSKVAVVDRQRDHTSKRGGCKAMVLARTTGVDGRACYTHIVLEHNHKLVPTPSMTRRMRSHKKQDPAVVKLVDTMHAGHVAHVNVMRVLRRFAGGSENLHLTERDIQNRRAAQVREERVDDIPKLQAFFRECKLNNPQFFYEFQVDDKNVVKNVFWSHASQQGDYADYSGVVTFDTTYKTNQYSMPLAMFVGFNSQLQNVVFGQALLRDEKADTFEWLFKQFRACMGGRDPIVIFTDQDPSIEKAVREVFRSTYHRYCRWHVTNKYRLELNQLNAQHPGLSDTLTSVINHPLSPAEFVGAWEAMLDKYSVHESRVLAKLFDERKMWIASYFKEIFCGTMTSTQRSESVNNVVKRGYCDNSTTIHEFAKSFLECLEHTRENETRETYNSQGPSVPYTQYRYDKQLACVYTRAVYHEFKERFLSSTAFFVRPHPNKANYFLVSHTRPPTEFPWLQHEFWVKAIVKRDVPEESVFECECMRMEHTGMFCPHLVCVLTNLQVEHIPSKYIPKRYTREAKVATAFDRHDRMFSGPSGETKASRMLELLPDWCALQQSSVMSSEAVSKCKELLRQALDVVKEIPHDVGPSAPTAAAQNPVQEEQRVSASAPPVSNTKGGRRGSVAREGGDAVPAPHFNRPQTTEHTRRCSTCHRSGHNAATCGREPPPKRPRGRPVGSGRGRGRGGRKGGGGRGYVEEDDIDEEDYEMELDDECGSESEY
ncbi:unnamed protein product [Urochloa decumbens]|uniref:Protein FAR1-RELATED SEQUENCE n=1 Tax=Urochloa decumbens TaxID=240449 RepID=A0ABC9A250_9POAL